MYSLAIETSSINGGVCFYDKTTESIVFERTWLRQKQIKNSSNRSKSHSELVAENINAGLTELSLSFDQIDEFITSIGPGSFTGIRVGLNAVKAFCYSQARPYICINSLLLLATNGKDQSLPVLTIVNAYKNQVYTALYEFNGDSFIEHISPCSLTLPQLSENISEKINAPVLCIGDGFDCYQSFFSEKLKKSLIRDEKFSDFPQVSQLAKYAPLFARPEKDWKLLNPLYIRDSEAEEKLRSGTLKPLPGL